MKRYVDENEILKRVPADKRAPLVRLLGRAPTAPDLVSRKVAAEILGVQSPHIARFEKQERMPESIPIEGTAPAYVREEIEALRDEIKTERAERRAKKEEAGK